MQNFRARVTRVSTAARAKGVLVLTAGFKKFCCCRKFGKAPSIEKLKKEMPDDLLESINEHYICMSTQLNQVGFWLFGYA